MKNVYEDITNKIIEQMQSAGADWSRPWAGMDSPTNITTGKRYSGVNVLLLGMASAVGGYDHNIWGTFKQWLDKGGKVKKGSKATDGIFFKQWVKEDKETEEKQVIPVIKGFKHV